MGTTPKFAIPYVEPTDLLANFPVADKAQADRIEALLTGLAHDSGWITGGTGATVFVANVTNFTLTQSRVRVYGGRVQVLIIGSMKVVSANMGTDGDITNLQLGTMAAPYIPSLAPTGFDQGLTSGGTGRSVAAYIQPTGIIGIGAISGAVELKVGELISVQGTYLL